MSDLESDSGSESAALGGRAPLRSDPGGDDDGVSFLVEHSDASPGSECGDDPLLLEPSSSSHSACPSTLSEWYDIPLRRTNLPAITGAILAAGTTGGITYAFGLYASALKHTLHLTQSELDTISSAFFCAGLLSWAPGMAADKYGPRRSLAAGGLTGAAALLGFWAVARKFIPVPREVVVPVLSLLGVGSFMSSALVTGSVFKLIVASTVPGTKGSAVGAAKGYVGLGAGAYACLFEALRGGGSAPPPSGGEGGGGGGGGSGDESDLNFLPMAAVLAVLVGTLPALCLIPRYAGLVDPNPRRRKPLDAASSWHFRSVYAGLLGLGGLVVGSSVMELYDGHKEHQASQHDSDGEDGMNDTAEDKKKFGERDLGGAVLIVAMWILPILGMLVVPRKRKSGDAGSSPEEAMMAAADDDASESEGVEDPTDPAGGTSLLEETRTGRGVPRLPRRLRRGGKKKGRGARYAKVGTGADDSDGVLDSDGEEDGDDDDDDDEEFLDEEGNFNDEEGASSAGSELATGVEISEELHEDSHERSRPHAVSAAARTQQPSTSASSCSAPRPLGELPLTSMLRTPAAWLLLWTCTILCGGGTVMTNNVGQMAEALRLDPDTAPAALALFSAAQSAGRVCTGSMSEAALNWKRRVPRPAFLILASVCGFVSHMVLAFATSELWFVIGVAMTGWAFGMIWPLMVLIVGETFGTKNVGANYMFYDGVTSAAGTLLLSKFVAQEVYESHIREPARDHSIPGEDAGEEWGVGAEQSFLADDGLTCYGMGCFQLSHVVVAGLSLTCIGSSAALMYKTREVYERR